MEEETFRYYISLRDINCRPDDAFERFLDNISDYDFAEVKHIDTSALLSTGEAVVVLESKYGYLACEIALKKSIEGIDDLIVSTKMLNAVSIYT